jgi:hypothetical protein
MIHKYHLSKVILLTLVVHFIACAHLHARGPKPPRVPSSAVVGLLEEYRKEAVWFRDDHPQGQYTRVNSFSCGPGLQAVEQNYNNRMTEFFTPNHPLFRSMPQEQRHQLRNFLPTTWQALERVAAEPSLTGGNGAFLLSVAIRETGANPFLEEGTQSRFYKKPGTGLMQMTAIHKFMDGKPVLWAFDDYESYKEIYDELAPPDTRLPSEVSYANAREIRTSEEFVESAFNPYASLWYGNEKVEGQTVEYLKHARFRKDGFDFEQTARLGETNRAAVLGTVYNAGCHRLRCAVVRAKIWNEDPRTETMNPHDWTTLRSFLYLDSSKAREAGVPSDLVTKLKNACTGRSDPCSEVAGETCSCLDNESDNNRKSALDGYAWRAAIAMSYGDHIKKISACFQ